MDITVDFYGVTQRLAGGTEHVVTLFPGARISDLLDALALRWPDLGAILPGCACAVGDSVVSRLHHLAPGERLALLPPVSGG